MEAELKKISSLVSRQFPEFYREEGDDFVTFVKAYYEWMDEGGPIFKSRRLLEYSDVDEVSTEYIDNYLSKFMFGIPRKVLSDKALLEKHILDVYRSKGSVEGLKLLFRLLYDLEILLFVPQEDMLRTSDGTWQSNQYIEIEETDINHLYHKKYIKGTTSGAVAFVSSSVQIYTGLQVAHVLYVKDLVPGPSGSLFVKGEYLLTDGINILEASKVKGSAIGATVFTSSENNTPGDPLQTTSTSGEGLIYDVSTLTDSDKLRGYLRFILRDGGYGYSTNSTILITQGANTKGSGAVFKVKSISNTVNFTYNTNLLDPEMNTLISAASYGSNLKMASVGSVIGNALTDSIVQVGTIASLGSISSGDHRYDGDVTVEVIDYKVKGYGIKDPKGKFWGNDSIIHGVPTTGNGVIETVELISSGFGFNDDETLEFYNTANSECSAELTIISGAIGKSEGEWTDTSGFLNADKYIQDSDYYQEFSYEIQVEKSLDKYIDVLKQVYHPVGNKVFGHPTILDSKNLNTELVYDSVTTT
jgi:hypothetical protein